MSGVSGVATVARLELRQRLRAGRWQVLLVLWFLVLALVTYGARQAVIDEDSRGAAMFGALALFLLVLALLVVPALSSQSVNGDRERGVLALLQVTDLRPWEITLGKAAAAWGVALVFLAASLPLALWCLAEGGVGLGRLAVVTLVQALLLGVVVCIALALSALLARTTTSAVLSYLSVVALTLGTLLAFSLATLAVTEEVTVTGSADYGIGAEGPYSDPGPYSYTTSVTHQERVWWLLAPNPVVIMVDASPDPPPQATCQEAFPAAPGGEQRPVTNFSCAADPDVLQSLREEIRRLRVPPDPPVAQRTFVAEEPAARPAVWPTGLAVDLALAAGALVVTTRRLRTPARTLPRGTRVA